MFALCGAVLALSLVLGGGSRTGFLFDSILQLSSVPLLLLASANLYQIDPAERRGEANAIAAFCFAIIVIPLLQLLPLPPAIWSLLPERDPLTAAFEFAGAKGQWAPLTVAPTATWLSLLSLTPPLAVFIGTLCLSHTERRQLIYLILGVGLLGAGVGLVQVAQGPNSPLRFFDYTNPSEAVGFFANRNHFAAFLYCLTVFASAWLIEAGFNDGKQKFEAARAVPLITGFVFLVILIAAQLLARSRAGLGLTIAALFLAWPLAHFDVRRGTGVKAGRVFAAAISLSVIFALQFALLRVLERFGTDMLDDARLPFARNTIDAIRAFMPFGSGMGSFVDVYGMFERREDVFAAYANHAHNDVLEVALEAGLPGFLLMTVFGGWILRRSIVIWRSQTSRGAAAGILWERAGSLVVVLLLIHSFVDYPLRTTAMAVVFAFSCGLLVRPFASVEEMDRTPQQLADCPDEEHLGKRFRASGPVPSGEIWGDDIDWPDEWRPDPSRHNPRGR